jgi:hypothetical protein
VHSALNIKTEVLNFTTYNYIACKNKTSCPYVTYALKYGRVVYIKCANISQATQAVLWWRRWGVAPSMLRAVGERSPPPPLTRWGITKGLCKCRSVGICFIYFLIFSQEIFLNLAGIFCYAGCIKKPANTIICIILLLTSISMSVLLILLLGFENTF